MPSPRLLPWLRLIGPLGSGSSAFILPDFRPAWFVVEELIWSLVCWAERPRSSLRDNMSGVLDWKFDRQFTVKNHRFPGFWTNIYCKAFPPFCRFICNRQPSVMSPYFLFSLFCFFPPCSRQHIRITTALLNIVNKLFTLGFFLSAFWPPSLCTKSLWRYLVVYFNSFTD